MATREFRPQRSGSGDGIYDDFVPDGVVTEVLVSGTPQAEPATSVGSVSIEVDVSGTPQAEFATSVGDVEVAMGASGSPQAEPATSVGSVEFGPVDVSGSPQAEPATSTGLVRPPADDEHDLRLKSPDGFWIPVLDHNLFSPKHTEVDLATEPTLGDVFMWDGDKFIQFDALDIFVAAGYGGVRQTGTPALPPIDLTPQILPANAGVVTTPKALTQDFANDGIILGFTGVWMLQIILAIDHDDVNTGREMELQLFDVTDATVILSTPVFIGRNQPGTNFSVSLMVEISTGSLDDLFVVRLVRTGANDILDVVLESYILSANLVSQLLVIP